MLETISKKIYHYNHFLNYDVISRNCQHFALDFIAALGLDCKFLTSEWLENHIREFVQHPNSIMPTRMGFTAGEFIEFLLKPNNKQIIYASIFIFFIFTSFLLTTFTLRDLGYAIVACGYWLSDIQLQISVAMSTGVSNVELTDLRQQEKVLHELYPFFSLSLTIFIFDHFQICLTFVEISASASKRNSYHYRKLRRRRSELFFSLFSRILSLLALVLPNLY